MPAKSRFESAGDVTSIQTTMIPRISGRSFPTGDVKVRMLSEADEPKPGTGGLVKLWADDKQIGEGRPDKTISLLFTTYAGMDMGRDSGRVVDPFYEDRAPLAFTGTVEKVTFDPMPAHHEAEKAPHERGQARGVGAGAAD